MHASAFARAGRPPCSRPSAGLLFCFIFCATAVRFFFLASEAARAGRGQTASVCVFATAATPLSKNPPKHLTPGVEVDEGPYLGGRTELSDG